MRIERAAPTQYVERVERSSPVQYVERGGLLSYAERPIQYVERPSSQREVSSMAVAEGKVLFKIVAHKMVLN
jgi:hypothetical protein